MGVYTEAFNAALRIRPRLSISEWADRYRVIPEGTGPEPGPWRTDRAPYLRGIMDAICDPTIETVVVMIASQLGKTEILLNVLGYYTDQDPSPILVVQPDLDAAENFSKERVEPTFAASPTLRGKLESGKDGRGASRKKSNTIRVKHFPGGFIALVGANAPSGLASRAIRVVLCDEVDRFTDSAGIEGSPIKLAIQRTSNYANRKIVLVSTPTTDGVSEIQRWHERGDKRQYQVPCPHCGCYQVLHWERVKYKNAEGARALANTHYVCKHCEAHIDERHKLGMLERGQWVAQEPGGKIASFGDLPAILSPWVRWQTLAEEWCAANDARDHAALQVFRNVRLGEVWKPFQLTIKVDYLERRRERYGDTLPAGVLMLTAGVDVQDDRLELEIVGWGIGKESWGVQYLVLAGDPSQPLLWQQLEGVLSRVWRTAEGRNLGVVRACIDSGGHHTSEVYDFCRPRETRGWYAIIGRGGESRPIFGKPSRAGRQKAALFTIGVDGVKGTLMSRLLIEEEGPGYCHFPREPERGYGQAYFHGLLSEKLSDVRKHGRVVRREWVRVVERNEPFDCRVYATAAMEIFAPNFELIAEQYRPRQAAQTQAVHKPRQHRQLSRGVTV